MFAEGFSKVKQDCFAKVEVVDTIQQITCTDSLWPIDQDESTAVVQFSVSINGGKSDFR